MTEPTKKGRGRPRKNTEQKTYWVDRDSAQALESVAVDKFGLSHGGKANVGELMTILGKMPDCFWEVVKLISENS